jgi:hypothetical protein
MENKGRKFKFKRKEGEEKGAKKCILKGRIKKEVSGGGR